MNSGSNNKLVDDLVSSNYIRSRDVERVFRALDRGDYMTREQAYYTNRSWREGPLHLSAACIYSEVMERLELSPGLSFLNVGSGTGYLSTLVGLILGSGGINHGVEVHPLVVEYANKRLEDFMKNIRVLNEFDFCKPKYYMGNGLCLAPLGAPYDRVYCGAGCPEKYQNYFKQLIKVGGILVMPLNDKLVQVKRVDESEWTSLNVQNVMFATLREPTEEEAANPIRLEFSLRPPAASSFGTPVTASTRSISAPVTAITSSINAPVTASTSSISAPVTASTSSINAPVTASTSSISAPVTASTSSISAPVTASTSSISAPVTASTSSINAPVTASTSSISVPVTASTSSISVPVTASTSSISAPVTASTSSISAPVTASTSSISAPVTASTSSIGAPVTASTSSIGAPVTASTSSIGAPVTASTSSIGGTINSKNTALVMSYNYGVQNMRFHSYHSPNVTISPDCTIAQCLKSSLSCPFVFSARPVQFEEKVCLRIFKLSSPLMGLSVGFTVEDPGNRSHIKLHEHKVRFLELNESDVLYCYLNSTGYVYISVNGQDERRLFYFGRHSSFWAVLYVQCEAVQLVEDHRAPNQVRRPNQSEMEETRVTSDMQSLSVEELPQPRYQPLVPLSLHRTKGRSIQFTDDRGVAARMEGEYCQGYVFSAQPVSPGLTIVIQILATDSQAGSLAIGVTSCDPATLQPHDLPNVSNQLVDRQEYWVVHRDAANNSCRGDEIVVTFLEGQVDISRDGSNIVTMCVDHSISLWAFVDLYGATQKVRLLSSQTAQIPPQQPRVRAGRSEVQRSDCTICLQKPIDSTLYPCGHICMCHDCAEEQWKRSGNGQCPICRKQIKDVIYAYMS